MAASISGLLGTIFKLYEDASTGAIKREHIALLQEQVQPLVKKIEDVEEENARLKKSSEAATRQLAEYAAREQFIEFRGVLFKKALSGGYYPDAYCPACRTVLMFRTTREQVACSRCKFIAPFIGGELPSLVSKLPGNIPAPAAPPVT